MTLEELQQMRYESCSAFKPLLSTPTVLLSFQYVRKNYSFPNAKNGALLSPNFKLYSLNSNFLFPMIRSRHVSHLVSPLNTVLDDSIGCALWFAARGTGHLRSSHMNCGLQDTLLVGNKEDIYKSQAKVYNTNI